MAKNEKSIRPLYFKDVVDSDLAWDVVYEDCGIAFRDGLTHSYQNEGVWEINMVIFIICIKGEIHFSERDREITLSPGDVMVRMPGSIFTDCVHSPEAECKVLCLSPDVLGRQSSETGFFDRVRHLADNPVINMGFDSDSISLMKAYETILKIKSRQRDSHHYRTVISHLTECMLYEFINRIPAPSHTDAEHAQGCKYELFNSFIALLAGDRGAQRSVKAYAERLNVSAKYLSAVCRKFSGKPALEWINEALKREIERLLHYTDLSVKEISVRLKFADSPVFAKYVRKHFGMTAVEYRTRLRRESGFH